jgi:hypothetical protein
MTIDIAYNNLETFESSDYSIFKESDLTESDTRSKILDYLLKEVLCWQETQIEREGFARQGFFDYQVTTPTFGFVIEAKRNHSELALPSKGNRVKLRTIYKSNEEVVNQIRIYLFEKSLHMG